MNLLVIGSTGLVGSNLINLLENSELEFNKICFISSLKSRNKILKFRNKFYVIKTVNDIKFSNYTHAITLTSATISKQIIPSLLYNNVVVIDNSSAYRNIYNLTIPEINFKPNKRMYINPNCCVIQSIIPLFYLNNLYNITDICYNTYQSCSGGGYGLYSSFLNKEISKCIPLIGEVILNDSAEEEKLINETNKLLNSNIKVSANCVRVPVGIGHLVNIIFKASCTYEQALAVLNEYTIYKKDISNIDLNNDFNIYTTRLKCIDFNTFSFYSYANNLLRGAAYNSFLTLKYIINNNK